MQAYEVRRGHSKNLEGEGLRLILEEIFGDVSETEGVLAVSEGAIKRMTAWFDGKILYVDTDIDRDVDETTAAQTVRAYNAFLERATGFTSKERRQRLQKKAKEGKL